MALRMWVRDGDAEDTSPPRSRADLTRVRHALEEMCQGMHPGDRVPTHTELMVRFQASERTILRALNDMQRIGRIHRRRGSGTFVADTPAPSAALETPTFTPPLLPADFADETEQRTIIAVTLPDRSFFDRCMDLLYWYSETANLTLICQPIRPDSGPIVPASATEAAKGIILFSYELAPLARQLQDNGCRVVVMGVPPLGVVPDIPCVYCDHEQGGYVATKHLIELGHRRIAFATLWNDLRRRLRWKGYQNALQEVEEKGMRIESVLLSPAELECWQEEPQRATQFFRAPNAPTALVAWNDREATTLLWTLLRAGIKVPDEVSLVGYDALPESKLVYPPLTTIDHAIGQQINAAMDLLLQSVPPSPTHCVITPPTLIRRESTAPPPPPSY